LQGWEAKTSPLKLELKTDFQTFSLPVELCKTAFRSAGHGRRTAKCELLDEDHHLLPQLVGLPSTF
jgi:hypothetical protein